MQINSFEYCAYWVEVQSDGKAWIYEGSSEFDYPNPVKICDSASDAMDWIERGL